jgi:hypothetical protein
MSYAVMVEFLAGTKKVPRLTLGPTQLPVQRIPRNISVGRGWSSQSMKLTTYTHLELSLEWAELYLHYRIHLHGMQKDNFAFTISREWVFE